MSNRRFSLPLPSISKTVQTTEIDEPNYDELECLKSFLEELLDLHNYGVELLKKLTIRTQNLNCNKTKLEQGEKINYVKKQHNLMIDEIFVEISDNEDATGLRS